MRPVALIVAWHTPELLALCLASLKRFAPDVVPHVVPGGPGAAWHARAIETARPLLLSLGYDPVILLDTDTVILSERWWPTLERAFDRGHDVIGGHRTRGDACQMFWRHVPLLHASMLAMRRERFDAVPSFAGDPVDQDLGCVTRDTAWRASLIAQCRLVLPYFPVSRGPVFPGLQVGEYFTVDHPEETLWSHLWRGTGMPAGGRWRQRLRRVRAACGSERARTVQRAMARKDAWMTRAWEIVQA